MSFILERIQRQRAALRAARLEEDTNNTRRAEAREHRRASNAHEQWPACATTTSTHTRALPSSAAPQDPGAATRTQAPRFTMLPIEATAGAVADNTARQHQPPAGMTMSEDEKSALVRRTVARIEANRAATRRSASPRAQVFTGTHPPHHQSLQPSSATQNGSRPIGYPAANTAQSTATSLLQSKTNSAFASQDRDTSFLGRAQRAHHGASSPREMFPNHVASRRADARSALDRRPEELTRRSTYNDRQVSHQNPVPSVAEARRQSAQANDRSESSRHVGHRLPDENALGRRRRPLSSANDAYNNAYQTQVHHGRGRGRGRGRGSRGGSGAGRSGDGARR